MNRYLLLICALAVYGTSINAQQDPQFTQWFMEPASFNPAVAGNSDLTCISGTYRNQWQGLDRDPNTSMLTAHTFVDQLKGGVLLSFYNDALGQEENTMARLGYAYHLEPLSNGAIVSLGLAASMFSKTLGNDWIAIDDYTLDDAIPNDQMTASAIDLDFGFYMHNADKFYLGLSSTHLLQSELAQMSITPARHYYAMTGYNFAIDGDFLVLRTNFLAKTDFNATAVDFNVNLLINEMFWIGSSWRPGDAISPVAGLQHRIVKKDAVSYNEQFFRLGYSYDITTSELQTFSTGSHEVFLSYSFKFESTPIQNRYANPRIL